MPAKAGISMTVQPLVAEFNVPAGGSGHTTVTVSNNGSEPTLINAKRVDWRTVADGSIALEKVGAERRHSITRDLSLSSYQFVLQPRQTKSISLTLNVPANAAGSSSYWGGFMLTSSPVMARNSVGIAATVFVYENVDSPSKKLSLQSLRITSNGSDARLIARMRNIGQSYLRPLAHLTIAQAGRIYKNIPVTVNAIFPDSTRIVSQDLGALPAGDYRVELTIDYGGDSIIDGVTSAQIH
jgi:P pilus assembly chaperone PapD